MLRDDSAGRDNARCLFHYRMLATMVLLTFPLKYCVMIQQEGIMQDVYTFAGTDQCQLPEYGP